MVSTSEGVVYYCTVFLTAIVFLTEASAIATNYEKSTTQNKTSDSPEISPQRTKLTPTRGRGSLSKNQNNDRVSALTLNKLKANTRLESVPQNKTERELLLVSNSGGENEVKDKGGGNADDDDQKTLSQQVADGKYGLIQHEIFTIKPARLGVISYDVNPEVPKDNINNLGGLEPDDIWLAENHLLVLAGSGLGSMQNQWRPIDNYEAPKRQVQIPPNPKVPPPFPVQLSENGPIEYVKSDNIRPAPFPLMPPFFNPLLIQYQNLSNTQGQPMYGRLPPAPLAGPPYSQLKPSFPTNPEARPQLPPTHVKPLPGADFIPPYLGNVNTSEAVDEDDPSLYYPPPYDFYYVKDNTTNVPPGPLVPGIILPPPPDFFILWSNSSASKDISKFTPIKEKAPRKQNNAFKAGKQLKYSPPSRVPEPQFPIPAEPPPPKYIHFNDFINELTYPDTHDDKITYANIKVNKVSTDELNEDWIPIPAPKPFYITGEKKPSKNTVLVVVEPPETFGYNYDKPPTPLKIAPASPKKPLLKYLQYVDKPGEQYVPTTTPISPQLANTKSSLQDNAYTTTPLSSYQQPTIKATYYFYEEPKFVDAEKSKSPLSTASPELPPATSLLDYGDYLLTKSIGNHYQPTKSILHDEPTPPLVRGPQHRDKKRKPVAPPMIPIYYLAELENLVDLVTPMNLPTPYATTQPPPKSPFYTTTAKPTYVGNKPGSHERPTPKPIFEYNYVASDYNGPSAAANPPPPHSTTQAPISYENALPHQYPIDYNAHYRPPEYHPHVYNHPLPSHRYNKPIQTTASPILLLNHHYAPHNAPSYTATFDRPWLPNLNVFNQQFPSSYTTDNPYYAFFTKEEEDLIDENTKKYFTIFGQKIKQNVEATSPLPVKTSPPPPPPSSTGSWRPSKYGFSSVGSGGGGGSISSNNHHQVSTSTPYPSQSSPSSNYYSSTTPYSADYTSINNHRRPAPSNNEYAEVANGVGSGNSGGRGGGSSTTTINRPLSLEGDTIVNYVTPLNEDNPDAEYVSPKISKHIRPIVVEDLPADINERLKNVIKLQKSKNTQNRGGSKTRYVLIDHEYDNNDDDDNNNDNNNNNNNNEYVNRPRYQVQKPKGNPDGKYNREASSSAPISLEGDVRVNYKSKLTKDPDAEYVATSSAYSGGHADANAEFADDDDDRGGGGGGVGAGGGSSVGGYARAKAKKTRNNPASRTSPKPVSLKNDILVNYKQTGRYTTDADAEYIGTGTVRKTAIPRRGGVDGGGGGSSSSNNRNNFVSYEYPHVEHGHFYFLTPQEAHLTQIEDERYDFQSNVEKPSSYFKRRPRDSEETTRASEKFA